MTYSLYFHIPFCTKKCGYCHFYVVPDKEPLKKLLHTGLKQEWSTLQPLIQGKVLTSIYFGGGTPSLFGVDAIADILQWLPRTGREEVTMEANPETLSFDLARAYKEAGINRLSLGVQTFQDRLLQVLGRTHSASKAPRAIEETVAAGITNLSIDLMYDLPHQNLADWQHSLEAATQLPITHLSLYNLTIEPHTSFHKRRQLLQPHLPDPDVSSQMYQLAVEVLDRAGLKQYEISAFAREGYPSIHNSGYWEGRPFLGLGPSAFSYWEGRRFQNICHLHRYCHALEEGRSPVDYSETLTADARRRELLAIGIRLKKGVDLLRFETLWGPLDSETQAAIASLEEQGLLTYEKSTLKLTFKGTLFYDSVASELI